MEHRRIARSVAALLLLAALTCGSSTSWADPPDTYLFGAEIELSTPVVQVMFQGKFLSRSLPGRTLKGYVALSALDVQDGKFDPSSSEALALFKKNGLNLCPADTIFKIAQPETALVTSLKEGSFFIPVSSIVRIKKWSGQFNGYHAYAQPFYVPLDQIKLLREGKMVYACPPRYAFVEGAYWVSFNPKIGKTELAPVCEGDYRRPAPQEKIRELESLPGVFVFQMPVD